MLFGEYLIEFCNVLIADTSNKPNSKPSDFKFPGTEPVELI